MCEKCEERNRKPHAVQMKESVERIDKVYKAIHKVLLEDNKDLIDPEVFIIGEIISQMPIKAMVEHGGMPQETALFLLRREAEPILRAGMEHFRNKNLGVTQRPANA